MAVEAKKVTVDGRTLRALIDLAVSLSDEQGEDPRPALVAALGAATLIGADVPVNEETLGEIAMVISRAAAEVVERMAPDDGEIGLEDLVKATADKSAA